ncbi:LysR family transcriptional regulator [Pigmentiphaga soli]|uniref:LysR family transcriptional regulator n=1 Tax=Pigmentiphaga soli TaxID=1007095 RepID=A0ABP8GUG4_9BURK
MKINLSSRDLAVFLTLAKTLSFSQTAQQVHLSQSALSALIARLEHDLDARLFERTTRSVALTAAGEVLRSHAEELVSQVDRTAAAVRDVVLLRQGSVAVAALPSIAASIVPSLFMSYSQRYPGVHLSLTEAMSEHELELVRQKRVDFALVGVNPLSDDVDYTPLAVDPFVLIMPVGHPLASGPPELKFASILPWPHISSNMTVSMRQHVHATALRMGVQFMPRYEVNHLATTAAMVAQGLGVAALPLLAAKVLRSEGLVQKPIVQPAIKRTIGLITRRDGPLSLAATEMVRMLGEQFGKRLPEKPSRRRRRRVGGPGRKVE